MLNRHSSTHPQVCKRWRRILEEDGLEFRRHSPEDACRLLRTLAPERLAALTLATSDLGPLVQWRDLDAALAAAAPRLRPSLRLRFEGLGDVGNPVLRAALSPCSTATPRRLSTSPCMARARARAGRTG
jgi:hypothetical protein